jgi:ribonucleoside-diphosphate reductase beta chain
MGLLKERSYYKPFKYHWAYEAFKVQSQLHWLPTEVPLHEDVADWKHKLNDSERHLLTNIFRFFTQADIDVASGYIEKFMPHFKAPELRMMMSTFASMEAIHIDAYSLLIETIGMPESTYKEFQEFVEMKEKHDYLWKFDSFLPDLRESSSFEQNIEDLGIESLALDLAKFSAFSEGLQLFSSFVILLNFSRFGKMKQMGKIITWSVRDESLHVESMIKVFKTLIDENEWLWVDNFKKVLYDTCRDMVELEDKFISLAFSHGPIEGLTEEEVKLYIRYIADRRLLQLGLKPNYGVSKNPLPWLDWMLNGSEHQNFFEGRATDYSKGALKGEWSNVWENHQ